MLLRRKRKSVAVDPMETQAKRLIESLVITDLAVQGGAIHDDVITITVKGMRKW